MMSKMQLLQEGDFVCASKEKMERRENYQGVMCGGN